MHSSRSSIYSFTTNITQIKRRRDCTFSFFICYKQNTIAPAFYFAKIDRIVAMRAALIVPKAFSVGVVVCCNYSQMASDWGVVVFVKNRWLDGLRLTLPVFLRIHFRICGYICCTMVRNHPKRNNNNNQFRCQARTQLNFAQRYIASPCIHCAYSSLVCVIYIYIYTYICRKAT